MNEELLNLQSAIDRLKSVNYTVNLTQEFIDGDLQNSYYNLTVIEPKKQKGSIELKDHYSSVKSETKLKEHHIQLKARGLFSVTKNFIKIKTIDEVTKTIETIIKDEVVKDLLSYKTEYFRLSAKEIKDLKDIYCYKNDFKATPTHLMRDNHTFKALPNLHKERQKFKDVLKAVLILEQISYFTIFTSDEDAVKYCKHFQTNHLKMSSEEIAEDFSNIDNYEITSKHTERMYHGKN